VSTHDFFILLSYGPLPFTATKALIAVLLRLKFTTILAFMTVKG